MELTRFVPARTKRTAAVVVGAMALTLAGLHAPGAGAASQQPPACQSFTIADGRGTATGPVTGDVQVAPIPGAQVGTQAGGGSTQGTADESGQAGQTGQPDQPGAAGSASGVPETVSCVAEVGGASDPLCIVTSPDAASQTGAFSTDAGTSAQNAVSATNAQAGATQAQAGDVVPSSYRVLDPNDPAAVPVVEQGVPAGQAGTGAGGATTAQSGQPFAGTGGDDIAVASAIPGGTVATCDAVGGVDTGAPVDVIGNGSADSNATTSAAPAAGQVEQVEQVEQSPAGGCEETILSETPLPSGGSIKVSLSPC